MNGMTIAAGAALMMTLAACGGGKKEAQQQQGASFVLHSPGGDVAVGGTQAPRDMPAYAPLYPGAKVDSTLSSGKGGIVGFTVADRPEAVMAFYQKAAAANKLTSRMNAASGEGSRVGIFSDPGSERSLTVSVAPNDDGQPGTRVGLTYGMP